MKSQLVKLAKLCKIQSGGTPRRGVEGFYGGTIPWAKIGDIENAQNGFLFNTVETITPTGLKSINNRIFPKNTILLAMYGSVGKTSIAGLEMATNQAILGLQPNNPDILYFKYLRYWLDYSKNNLINKARGVALQNISATIIKEFEIPLLPLDVQKRIVIILDRADSLRQKRKQAIKLLDEYLKFVFLEMFGNPMKNLNKYPVTSIKDIAIKVTDGEHITPKRTTSGIKLLSARNVKNGYIDFKTGVDYIPIDEYERIVKRCNPEFGDLLISCSGTIGRVTTVNITEPFTLVRSAALVKPDKKKIEVKYLEYLLRSSYLQDIMFKSVNQSSQANLFLGQINKIPVLLPPIEQQQKFVKRVEQKELLKQKMLLQSQELDTQFQALMQKSFQIVM